MKTGPHHMSMHRCTRCRFFSRYMGSRWCLLCIYQARYWPSRWTRDMIPTQQEQQ